VLSRWTDVKSISAATVMDCESSPSSPGICPACHNIFGPKTSARLFKFILFLSAPLATLQQNLERKRSVS
jgi:hypothetical protein